MSTTLTAAGHTRPNRLVEEFLYLVSHVVHQLGARYPAHVDRGELWSAGALGLVDASRKYDPSTGVPFDRYANIRIRGAVIDSTRHRDWASRSVRRQARDMADAADTLTQQHGRTPTDVELADQLSITVDELHAHRQAAEQAILLHLDKPVVTAGDEVDTLEALLTERDPDVLPADALEDRELRGLLRVAIDQLDEPHREVISRCFFDGDRLADVADDLQVTQARISQLRNEAVTTIRAWMATQYDGVPPVDDDAPGFRRRAAYLARMREHADWQAYMQAADTDVPADRNTDVS